MKIQQALAYVLYLHLMTNITGWIQKAALRLSENKKNIIIESPVELDTSLKAGEPGLEFRDKVTSNGSELNSEAETKLCTVETNATLSFTLSVSFASECDF